MNSQKDRAQTAARGGVGDRASPAAGAGTLDLSIIVPALNEEDSIRPLYDAVVAAVAPLGLAFELILVDDGSTDATFARCADIAAQDSRVRAVKLRRNYGQTPAMVAGIDHAEGRIVVTMDADLQNDPADIPLLLREIEAGYNIVVGWRHQRQDKFWSRRLPSVVANWIIARITGIDVKDNGCTLKAFRAELLQGVPLYSEMHRFIPAMASIAGARLAQVKVRHHPRRFGTSKYGISRIYKVCLDLMTIRMLIAFARRPMFCFMTGAAAFAALALLCLAVAGWQAFAPSRDSAVVFMGISFLFGSLGLFLALSGFIGSLVHQSLTTRE